jgi:hypothetical protein
MLRRKPTTRSICSASVNPARGGGYGMGCHLPVEALPPALDEIAQRGRRHGLQGHGAHRQRCAERRHQRTADQAVARGAMQALLPGQTQGPAAPVPGMFGRIVGTLAHLVAWRHHHRAQRRRRFVVEPAPVHRHAEETGGAEGFQRRVDFLKVPARSLLTIVHAEDQLRSGLGIFLVAPVIGGQRREDAFPVVALVGQQPEMAALMRSKLRR